MVLCRRGKRCHYNVSTLLEDEVANEVNVLKALVNAHTHLHA